MPITPLLFFVVAITFACLNNKPALAANIEFKPSIAISEEFTDNILEVAKNKRNEYITRVQPGFSSRYEAPLWNWDMGYNFDYQNYARNSRSNDYTHYAKLIGNISLLNNFLNLHLDDSYQRVTLDVARDVATESSLFLNQTDQNKATIFPYLIWRLGEKSSLKTGYSYTDIRYWGEGIERREHGAIADLNHEFTSQFSLTASYGFTHLESRPSQYNQHNISGGFRYEYADKSFIFGKVGNTWQQFKNGGSSSFIFWNAGITHDMGFAVATLESNVQTAVDPLSVSTKETSYIGKIEKKLQRGMIDFSVGYSEFIDSETNNGNRRKLAFSSFGSYEIMPSLTSSIGATFDHFYETINSGMTGTDFYYHLSATAGLGYTFYHDIKVSLNYIYDTKRNAIDNATDAIVTNRVALELRKTF